MSIRTRHMSEFRLPLAALVFALAFCCPVMAATDPADTHPEVHLIPWPKSLQKGAGHMRVTGTSRVVAGEDQLRPLAEVLTAEIATVTGLKLQVTSGPGRAA
jgi:hypothetical protein